MFDWLRRGKTGSDSSQSDLDGDASGPLQLLIEVDARLQVLEGQNASYRIEMADIASRVEEVLGRSLKARDRAEVSERRQAAKGAKPANGDDGGERPWETNPEGYANWLENGRPDGGF